MPVLIVTGVEISESLALIDAPLLGFATRLRLDFLEGGCHTCDEIEYPFGDIRGGAAHVVVVRWLDRQCFVVVL